MLIGSYLHMPILGMMQCKGSSPDMFKKPLSGLKTSAPLRSSDRRKLKKHIVSLYGLQPEEGDILMPEGILSVKFSTHIEEHGVGCYKLRRSRIY